MTSDQVEKELRRLHQGKSAGPDGVSPRVLRNCAVQLAPVLEHLFNLSLRLRRVPERWKTSCIVPVPKGAHPKTQNDYRPVVLTSHVMKTLERLVLQHLRPLVSDCLDPLQFAYRAKVGVEDAIIYMLQRAYAHLENKGSMVRIMFFDFSSAFKEVVP